MQARREVYVPYLVHEPYLFKQFRVVDLCITLRVQVDFSSFELHFSSGNKTKGEQDEELNPKVEKEKRV